MREIHFLIHEPAQAGRMVESVNTVFSQEGFDIRFEWGANGLRALSACATLVIVDVLSFSTCVDVAIGKGAEVFPFAWKDERAVRFAEERAAILAAPNRNAAGPTLSPASLIDLPTGSRLVLPSPNGSALSALASASAPRVYSGCLRNASATARALAKAPRPVGIIAAGERWTDATIRPAIEDLLGAGAIISALAGTKSAEAQIAGASFAAAKARLSEIVAECGSGRELTAIGFQRDVILASMLDTSVAVALMRDGRYVSQETESK